MTDRHDRCGAAKRRRTAPRHRKLPAIVRRIVGESPAAIPFRDLPTEAKYAVIYYMCVDGEAWPEVADAIFNAYRFDAPLPNSRERRWHHARTGKITTLARVLDAAIPVADQIYGDLLFGYAEVPASALIASIEQDAEFRDSGYDSFADYHRSFVRDEPVTKHHRTRRWPVILSSEAWADKPQTHETLQDGWHRFHSYYAAGDATVPVVFYAY